MSQGDKRLLKERKAKQRKDSHEVKRLINHECHKSNYSSESKSITSFPLTDKNINLEIIKKAGTVLAS